MSVFHTNALAGASGRQGAGGAAQYQIQRSLRFNGTDSAHLSRTPASTGNRKTWTWSGWVKRSADATGILFGSSTGTVDALDFSGSNLRLYLNNTSSGHLVTSQVFRDFSAWYHIVLAIDTTQATSSNRARIYVNGTEITAFSTTVYPTLNYDSSINNNVATGIGDRGAAIQPFSGYLADIHFIDGQALTPSSFGQTDATTGQWIPKAYTGDYGLVSVAAATGGLPIYNTTDAYGTVKGTGTRTDSNSSAIVLAVPMNGTNGGTTFTDESATIKGSGVAVTLTPTSATTSTSESKYYGSSGNFTGAAARLEFDKNVFLGLNGFDFTIEMWVKITGTVSTFHDLTGLNRSSYTNSVTLKLDSGRLSLGDWGAGNFTSVTDPDTLPTGKWVHVAYTKSGTTGRVFVNGIQKQSGTLSASSFADIGVNATIGARSSGEYAFPGYIQDVRIYKGVAKYTANFIPPTLNNSFRLDFADNSAATAAALGKDTSGNGNNWTPNNLSVTAGAGNDSLVDTPTSYGTDTGVGGEVRGNYCTLNPLDSSLTTPSDIKEGGLEIIPAAAYTSIVQGASGAIGVRSGKWYYEGSPVIASGSGNQSSFGWSQSTTTAGTFYGGDKVKSLGVQCNNNGNASAFRTNGVSASTPDGTDLAFGAVTGDIFQIAVDFDAAKIWIGRNGTWYNSGNPAAGTNPTSTFTNNGDVWRPWIETAAFSSSWNKAIANFGQRPFAYTAPSGFKALCDTNLPAPTIVKPSTVMDVKLYTGNGGTQTISGLGFSPDLVWVKSRSAVQSHVLTDAVRGTSSQLFSNLTDAQGTQTDQITALNSDGFSLGSNVAGTGGVNTNSVTYAAWCWDAGSSTVTNTDGTITSQVRANPSAGFSIVTFTAPGTAVNYTWGHGLGVAPQLVLVKERTLGTTNWGVFHSSVNSINTYLVLNSTAGLGTFSNVWGAALPTSSVMGGKGGATVNLSSNAVAYCFAPVAGYSAFGSYIGNGSADGPFVYTGFRPRWVMVKAASGAAEWYIYDAARSPRNASDLVLLPNRSSGGLTYEGESSSLPIDILSNGFKLRLADTAGYTNYSGWNYVFAAFAEFPFQFSRAR